MNRSSNGFRRPPSASGYMDAASVESHDLLERASVASEALSHSSSGRSPGARGIAGSSGGNAGGGYAASAGRSRVGSIGRDGVAGPTGHPGPSVAGTAAAMAMAMAMTASAAAAASASGAGDTAASGGSIDDAASESMAGSVGPGSSSASASAGLDDSDANFKVAIRVRPPLPRELHGDRPFQNVLRVDRGERRITISENIAVDEDASGAPGPYSTHTFTFDHVYGQDCDQRKVYETTAKAVVESSLQGYNATIFAYGQTGTGKTYTMEGFDSRDARGIIPRAIEQIFQHITSSVSPRMRFLVRASYLQIYNEIISDLLKPERTNLLIREDKRKGVYVEGLSEWVVRSPQEIYGLMERGGEMRATGSTRMNHLSSRSHAVFIIIAEQSETTYLDESGNELSVEQFHRLVKSRAHGDDGLKKLEANVRQIFKVGKLNLVDLAGSERVRLTGATGQRLEESRNINQSLSALGNVIAALTDPRGRQHIPYRDSKLTRILEDSLGGNCKTTMMAMISPALEAFSESLSTLKFANRAKNIKNEARVNEDLDQKSLLRRYERELRRLRTELEERSRNVVDKRRLLELDEQRRRAELDKMAAIRALEARSREFLREKEEKKRLEGRISALQGQMLTGGEGLTNNPAFRSALKEHQEKIRQKYEAKLHELERERETMEEEKAQVDRYKQLLLKQRDIMILLTQRLNERDDQIVALQDELDAYDRHQRELEEKLDEKTAALIHLQRVALEHNTSSPVKSRALAEALGAWSGGDQPGGTAAAAAGRGGEGDGVEGDSRTTPRRGAGTLLFRPHTTGAPAAATATPVPRGAAGEAVLTASRGSLLTGEQKVAELARLVDEARAEAEAARSAADEARAAQRSVEHVLEERVEALVQSELEGRGGDGGAGGGAAAAAGGAGAAARAAAETATLRERVRGLQAELREAHAAAREVAGAGLDREQKRTERGDVSSGEAGGPGREGPDVGEQQASLIEALRARLATHDKERRAIQTIVEHKIKALADSVAGFAAKAIGEQATPAEATAARTKLARESRALQRLVNASVAALRNSEAEAARLQKRERELSSALPPGAVGMHEVLHSRPMGLSSSSFAASAGPLASSRMTARAASPSAGNVTTAAPPSSGRSSLSHSFAYGQQRDAPMTSASPATKTAQPARSLGASSVDAMIRERKEVLLRQRHPGSEA